MGCAITLESFVQKESVVLVVEIYMDNQLHVMLCWLVATSQATADGGRGKEI